MILGNLLKGYINNGRTPGSVDELVNFGDDVNFVIDSDRLDEIASATGTRASDWTVSADGTKLYYLGQQAAFISDNDRIQLWESNLTKPNTNSVPSEGAKLLVGNYVPVKLVDEWCNLSDVLESYNVRFLTPLKFDAKAINVSLKDITTGGSSSSSFSGMIKITEAFTSNNRTVYINGNSSYDETKNVAKWYAVQAPVYDVANAMTNIQKDGTIGSTCNVRLSEILNADGSQKYTVNVANEQVTFHNMSGNAIGQAFKIEIPVVVNTKWQSMTAKIVVTVNPSI